MTTMMTMVTSTMMTRWTYYDYGVNYRDARWANELDNYDDHDG